MNEKLDIKVAEALGWEILRVGYFGMTDGPDSETPRQLELAQWLDDVGIESIGTYCIDGPEDWWRELSNWTPSTDIADARKMEDRIAEMVDLFRYRYAQAMDSVLQGQGFFPLSNEEYTWAILHATPEQRCLAFLKARGVDWREEE